MKTQRHSKRLEAKSKRRAERKRARERQRNGKKAGSIAIHSRLPGIEGTEIGSMGVIVDSRREGIHRAEITVTVSDQDSGSTTVWVIETGFGGHTPRVGFQVMPESQLKDLPPVTWMSETHEPIQAATQSAEPDDQRSNVDISSASDSETSSV